MLSLQQAQTIIDAAMKKGKASGMQPLTVAVLDARGQLKAYAMEEGALLRYDIATGKAYGALGMGRSSRALGKLAEERPMFVHAVIAASAGRLIPVPGGVLIKDKAGALLGAVGVSGDSSDNDEVCAIAGIEAAGLVAGD